MQIRNFALLAVGRNFYGCKINEVKERGILFIQFKQKEIASGQSKTNMDLGQSNLNLEPNSYRIH
jgi:hypothetical protein